MGKIYYIYLTLGNRVVDDAHDDSISFCDTPETSSSSYCCESFDDKDVVTGNIKELLDTQDKILKSTGLSAKIKIDKLIPATIDINSAELKKVKTFADMEKIYASEVD